MTKKQVKKAIIPVAGLGTRFLPATKAMPKEMLPIVDKPTLQYIVEEAVAAGIEDILFVTNRGKTAIENHFDHNVELELALEEKGKKQQLADVRAINDLANIFYVRQSETLGLGHAILCGRSFSANEPFVVLLGDDLVWNPQSPAIGQLIEVYNEYGASVIGGQEVEAEEISKYGCIDGEKIDESTYRLQSIVEKPAVEEAPSNMAALGRYLFEPEIFDYLAKTQPGHGGEIQLTDAIQAMAKERQVLAYAFEGRRYDIGSKQGFLEATVEFALRDEKLRDEFLAYLKSL